RRDAMVLHLGRIGRAHDLPDDKNAKKSIICPMSYRPILLLIFLTAASPVWAKSAAPDPQASFDAALSLEQKKEWFNARQSWQQFLDHYPDFERVEEAQEHLAKANIELLFSAAAVPES